MQEGDGSNEEISLKEYVEAVWRWKWYSLASFLMVFILVLVVASQRQSPLRYQSQGIFYIKPSANPGFALPTYSTFAISDQVLSEVSKKAGLNMSPEKLRGTLKVKLNVDQHTLEITSSAPSAQEAQNLVKAWHMGFTEFTQEGSIEVFIAPTKPTAPVNPRRKTQELLIALLLGLVGSIGIAFPLQYFFPERKRGDQEDGKDPNL